MGDYVLYHAGVKGMKWGKRLYQNKDGSLTPLGKARYRKMQKERAKNLEKARAAKAAKKVEAEERAKKIAKGKISVKNMSDDELKKRLERLKLENEVKDLNSKTTSRGKKFAMDVLENSAKNIATQLTTYAMGKAVNEIARAADVKLGTKTSKGDDGVEKIERVFEELVNPKKGQKEK